MLKIIILILDILGLKYLWYKIQPPYEENPKKRPPRTFILWFMSFYAACFSIATTRHEYNSTRLENRVTNLLMQIDGPNYKELLRKIPVLQNTKLPSPVYLFEPFSVLYSFLPSQNIEDLPTITQLQEVIFRKKGHLENAVLTNIILSRKDDMKRRTKDKIIENDIRRNDLSKGNFRAAWIDHADLENVNLKDANLESAILINTNLKGAELNFANLKNADLRRANLGEASIIGANFNGANLKYALLENAKIYGSDFRGANFGEINLKNVKYNSCPKVFGFTSEYDKNLNSFCAMRDATNYAECNSTNIKIHKLISPTKFPANFDPEKYEMKDICNEVSEAQK